MCLCVGAVCASPRQRPKGPPFIYSRGQSRRPTQQHTIYINVLGSGLVFGISRLRRARPASYFPKISPNINQLPGSGLVGILPRDSDPYQPTTYLLTILQPLSNIATVDRNSPVGLYSLGLRGLRASCLDGPPLSTCGQAFA